MAKAQEGSLPKTLIEFSINQTKIMQNFCELFENGRTQLSLGTLQKIVETYSKNQLVNSGSFLAHVSHDKNLLTEMLALSEQDLCVNQEILSQHLLASINNWVHTLSQLKESDFNKTAMSAGYSQQIDQHILRQLASDEYYKELLIVLIQLTAVDEDFQVCGSNAAYLACQKLAINFCDRDLSNIRLNDTDLSYATFCRANLSGSIFRNVDIEGCDFSYSKLDRIDWNNIGCIEQDAIELHGKISQVALSSDETLLAFSSCEIQVWDCLHITKLWSRAQPQVKIVRFINRHNLLLTGYPLIMWDAAKGVQVKTFHGYFARQDCLDTSLLRPVAASSKGASFQIWNLQTGRLIKKLKSADTEMIKFSHSGLQVATARSDFSIAVWLCESGSQILVSNAHQDWILSLAFTTDDKLLASGSYDQTILIWNMSDGQLVKTLLGHEESITALQFSFCGKYLASGGFDLAVKVWDLISGKPQINLSGHSHGITSLAISSKGCAVTVSHDQTVRLWRIEPIRPKSRCAASKAMLFGLSTDGSSILAANRSGGIATMNSRTGGETIITGEGEVYSATLSGNGSNVIASFKDQTVRQYQAEVSSEVWSVYQEGGVIQLQLTSPGDLLISLGLSWRLKVWDLKAYRVLKEVSLPVPVHDDAHKCKNQGSRERFRVSPNDELLAFDSVSSGIRVYRIQNLQMMHAFEMRHSCSSLLVFTNDSQRIIMYSPQLGISVRELTRGNEVRNVQNLVYRLESFVVSQDDRFICACVHGQRVQVFSITEQKCVWNLPEEVYAVQIEASADCGTLAMLLETDEVVVLDCCKFRTEERKIEFDAFRRQWIKPSLQRELVIASRSILNFQRKKVFRKFNNLSMTWASLRDAVITNRQGRDLVKVFKMDGATQGNL